MKDPRQIVRALQVTEKGTTLGEQSKYLIEVAPNANRIEVKQAVEALFDVNVKKVNTQNYRGKRKRMRSWRLGKRPDWKRAVVTLREGQSIDLA